MQEALCVSIKVGNCVRGINLKVTVLLVLMLKRVFAWLVAFVRLGPELFNEGSGCSLVALLLLSEKLSRFCLL